MFYLSYLKSQFKLLVLEIGQTKLKESETNKMDPSEVNLGSGCLKRALSIRSVT